MDFQVIYCASALAKNTCFFKISSINTDLHTYTYINTTICISTYLDPGDLNIDNSANSTSHFCMITISPRYYRICEKV